VPLEKARGLFKQKDCSPRAQFSPHGRRKLHTFGLIRVFSGAAAAGKKRIDD
jgi:hypothetical protein